MTGLSPYLRGAPPGLPFRWDVETRRRRLNFTLDTGRPKDLEALAELEVIREERQRS